MTPFFRVCITWMFISSLCVYPHLCFADATKFAPVLVNYQGILQDNLGNPLPGTHDMVFSIHDQESGGPFDWQENHTGTNAVTTDGRGVFNVVLNSTGTASGNLANLLRDNSTLWLEISVGGETLSPRQRLTSSAYALSTPWTGLTGVPTDFSDGTDDIASPGLGLDQSGSLLSIEPSYQLPQTATSGQVPKWNSTSQMWEPGNDNNTPSTTYSAGNGLLLIGSEFNIDFSGTGSAGTAARSDHHHMSETWNGASNPGLSITTSSTSAGATALKGVATGNAVTSAVSGENTSNQNDATGVRGIATSYSGRTSGVYGETASLSPGAKGVYGYASGGGNQTYGVYGRNITTSGFGVYSQGNAKVDGNLTVTGQIVNDPPKTGFVSITAAAFVPEKHDVDYENTGLYYKRLNGSIVPDFDKEAVANVQLPHGCSITNVTFKGWTDSSMLPDELLDFSFDLLRTAFNGYSESICSFSDNDFPPTGGLTDFTYSSSSIFNAEVDNSSYGYLIEIGYHMGLKTYGVIIEYTY